jgi:hypothetical protein
MAIIKANEMDFSNEHITILLYGLPGVGKTTLACSAPKPIVIDCDNGMRRVNAEHRQTTSVVRTYEDVLSDIASIGDDYETVVIDTCGSLIELMKQWVIDNKMCTIAKTGFSLQGYGIIKSEFARLMAQLRRKYNVVYIFHAVKEKTEDSFFFELLAEGATKATVWQPCDLGAYMYIQDGERWLGFTPSESYNAKSAYGVKGLVKVPELKDGKPNEFISKLIERAKESLNSESKLYQAEKEAYDEIMKSGAEIISKVETPDDMPDAVSAISQMRHVLTSKAELKTKLTARMTELGITYNGEKKAYEYKQQQ